MPKSRLIFLSILALAFMTSTGPAAEKVKLTPAENVRVQGDVVNRMKMAITSLDQATTAELWGGFTPEGMWGADWPGRTLEAYGRVSLSLGEVASRRFNEIGLGLTFRQSPDGAFHTKYAGNPYDQSNGFWFGHSKGLRGLVWAYKWSKDARYLNAAKKAGDYIVDHYFDAGQPGAPNSFWWVTTEALMNLYNLTGEQKYLDGAVKISRTITAPDLNGFHTHSYILSLRGCVQAYALTGEQALLEKVMTQYRFFKDQVMWPGGGIIEHFGSRQAFNINYWFDEGCTICDWIGLNLDLWRLTLDPAYMDMVERVQYNHFYYDQDQSGAFCGDRGVEATREGAPWRFCCSMHGTRTLSELTQYIAATDGKAVYVNLFMPGRVKLNVAGQDTTLTLETDYPNTGLLNLKVETPQPVAFALHIRKPAWSRIKSLTLNDRDQSGQCGTGPIVLSRQWQSGDRLALNLDLPLRAEGRQPCPGDDAKTDYSRCSIWQGARQLVYSQPLNNHLWATTATTPSLRYAYQPYGTLQRDRSYKSTPLKIGAREYQKGLGTHTHSEIEYFLGGQFREFRTDIGIDAVTGGKGSARFKVCVDGVVKSSEAAQATTVAGGQSGLTATLYGFFVSSMTGKDAPKSIVVDVTGAQSLRLVADDAVDGLTDDYADWADACLIKPNGEKVYLSDLPDQTAAGMPWDWGTLDLTPQANQTGNPDAVTLTYKIGDQTLPINFVPLGSLGYGLIKNRPVLQSYFKVKSGTQGSCNTGKLKINDLQ